MACLGKTGKPILRNKVMIKILIVEDNPTTDASRAVQRLNDDYEMERVACGQGALEKISSVQPDLIVLSHGVPNGLQRGASEALRELPGLASVIIFPRRNDENAAAETLTQEKPPMESTPLPMEHDKVLHRGEETYRELLNASREAAMLLERHGGILSINTPGRDLIEAAGGLEALGVLPLQTGPRTRSSSPWQTVTEKGEPARQEILFQGRRLEISLWPVFDPQRQVSRVALFFHDLTDAPRIQSSLTGLGDTLDILVRGPTNHSSMTNEKLRLRIGEWIQADQERKKCEAELAAAQGIARLGNWELDLKTGRVRCSEETLCILGLSPKTFGGSFQEILSRIHPEGRPSLRDSVSQSVRERGSFSMDLQLELPGGNQRLVNARGEVNSDSTGDPALLAGMLLDITEREKSVLALCENRRVLQTIFDRFPHQLFIKNTEGQYQMVNRTFSAKYDSGTQSFLSNSFQQTSCAVSAYCEKFCEQKPQVPHGKGMIAFENIPVRTREGNDGFYRVGKWPLPDGIGVPIEVGKSGEKTDLLPEATEKPQALPAMATEWMAEGVQISNGNGVIEFINSAFTTITGFDREEVLGQPSSRFLIGEDPGGADEAMKSTLLAGKVWQGRSNGKKKDGSHYETEVTVSPVLDDSGALTHQVAVHRDITRQQHLDIEHHQSQKLEAIGTMVSGIAHEINNILTPILGYSELLEDRLGKDEKSHVYLGRMKKSVLRARDFLAQISSFSGKGKKENQTDTLPNMVKKVVDLMALTLPKHIAIEQHIANDPQQVGVDAAPLQTVLINLCMNAGHAMPTGGILRISLDQVFLEDHPVFANDRASGQFARLTVQDTGTGMEAKTLERIFDPFYTTKEACRGTGLGLYTVYQTVKRYRGYISVTSTPGNGTRFELLFPIPADTEPELPGSDSVANSQGPGSILLVDDDEGIRSAEKRLLESLG